MAGNRDGYGEQGEILMGCWDCGSCGATRLRGDAYQCASCGAPRPEDVKFYLPSDADVVTDRAGIRAAEAGPDWQCAFCESWMPATDAACRNCQASAAESQRRQRTKTYQAGSMPPVSRDPLPPVRRDPIPPIRASAPPVKRAAAAAYDPERFADPLPRPARGSRSCLSVPVLMVMALVVVAAVIYGMNRAAKRRAYEERVAERQLLVVEHQSLVAAAQKKFDQAQSELDDAARQVESAEQAVARARGDVTKANNTLIRLQQTEQAVERAIAVNVASHGWNVQLQIEQCGAKEGEGWNHPPDAFDVRSEQRVHHHERVLDHVETLFRTETYRAQDGYDTETYTERVSAGTRQVPDGYDVEDLGNGRFRRTPRFRSEPVYEDVTRTRQTPRMVTKTRQIPYQNNVYRQDPIRKPWYTYHTKVWKPAPALSRAGEGLEVLDPEDRPPQNSGNELGARRVRGRNVTYSLMLQPVAGDSPARNLAVPVARWRAFTDGSAALLASNEVLTAAEQQARLASLRNQIDGTKRQIVELEDKVPPLAARIAPLRQQLPPLQNALTALQAALAKENLALSQEKQELDAVVAAGY